MATTPTPWNIIELPLKTHAIIMMDGKIIVGISGIDFAKHIVKAVNEREALLTILEQAKHLNACVCEGLNSEGTYMREVAGELQDALVAYLKISLGNSQPS
ncbi:MAG TPA: hypothetical protein VF607_06930 [Verrucomicrobiae bacterium]